MGTVAAIAAMGAITTAFMGAFKEGGYTGPGNPNAVAGLVHQGEFVMPADATSRIGLPALEAMKNGQASPITPSAGRFAVAVFDDRSKMKEWLQSNEGKSTILDLVGQNGHEFI
ncbi:MAG TPA: hypothetical protein VNT26_03410 [Candidatus Sulfotelmatobacter sp.]|nr:hypothetical protein [Candidatus Sulfotelmatobacter sp.]